MPLARLAARHGTPLWVISAGTLRRRYRALAAALAGAGLAASIHYAAKANDALAVLRLLAAEGAGADVVSVGELRAAEAAGIPPARIVYSGVGKTRAELAAALAAGVFQINADVGRGDHHDLRGGGAATGHTAPVALRVNPDVDARTHAKITTGKAENKFGIPYEEAPALYARMAGLPGIRPVGLATHIGSQITAGTAAFRAAYARLADLARELLSRGLPVARLGAAAARHRLPRRDPPTGRPSPAPSPPLLGGSACR